MASNEALYKYQIIVPNETIAKDINNEIYDLSIEPKYNRKIILKCIGDVAAKKCIEFEVETAPAAGEYTPAYPEGDSISVTPGIGEYKLKKMFIFNGLYNDYTEYSTIKDDGGDTYKEVLLVHEKEMGNDIHYLYVFFLMSESSDGGSENENTFFDVWKNSNLEIKGKPIGDQKYTTTGILDIIPRTKKVHIWKDLTRQLQILGNNATAPYSNVVSIIVNPETYTYKKIPSNTTDYKGDLFGGAAQWDGNCASPCVMKQIKTVVNGETQLGGENNDNTPNNLKLKWRAFTEAGTAIASGEDGGTTPQKVYFSSGLQNYWYSSNTFMMAFAGGGSGTVLTTCVEVEQKVAEGDDKKDKSISSYEEKHMLPEGKTWYGWDRRPGAKGEDAAAARLAFEKSFYPGPIEEFDKHYMFWILLFLGIAIFLFIIITLFNNYRLKVIPQAMKAKGMKV